MDKRFFLALLLTAMVVVVTPLLFPGATRPPVSRVATDSATRRAAVPAETAAAPTIGATVPTIGSNSLPNQPVVVPVETTTVHAQRSTYAFSSRGAAPISVTLDSFPSRRPRKGSAVQPVQLARADVPLAHYRLALGRDTVSLTASGLQKDPQPAGTATAPTLSYRGIAAGHPVQIAYQFVPDSFIVRVRAVVADAPAGSSLLVDLPRTLASNEPDTVEDMSHLALSYRNPRSEVENIKFGDVDSAQTRVTAGPLTWVAVRNKYFLVAYRTDPKAQPFSGLQLTGVPKRGKLATELITTAALPLTNGAAAFDVYAGPQDSQRLQRLGSDLDQANPYGGFLNGIVQPFATIIVKALIWVKRTTQLNYGWVLVLFGIAVRMVLWPLSQGAMRTSIKMQRLQPEMQAVQKKYADDPERLRDATMKLYRDHGMSPLSPLTGCLPMLIPMPILYALYHVFGNTVEFRGVPFLWLPDISLADPYFIAPLLMGASMFVMSWIGMKGSPPNPQAKMMSYMMPVVLMAVFWRFASGLNLYYAVQNIASLPQQWLLARERAKQPPVVATVHGPGPAVKRRS